MCIIIPPPRLDWLPFMCKRPTSLKHLALSWLQIPNPYLFKSQYGYILQYNMAHLKKENQVKILILMNKTPTHSAKVQWAKSSIYPTNRSVTSIWCILSSTNTDTKQKILKDSFSDPHTRQFYTSPISPIYIYNKRKAAKHEFQWLTWNRWARFGSTLKKHTYKLRHPMSDKKKRKRKKTWWVWVAWWLSG